jgi:hypothetical protein
VHADIHNNRQQSSLTLIWSCKEYLGVCEATCCSLAFIFFFHKAKKCEALFWYLLYQNNKLSKCEFLIYNYHINFPSSIAFLFLCTLHLWVCVCIDKLNGRNCMNADCNWEHITCRVKLLLAHNCHKRY